MTNQITIDRKVVEQVLEALQLGQDAFNQAFGGYGYYRPENPHNFFPDPECCTEKEIAYHSAACEAYDKGTYVPDHSDGWITPELHVTKAPWGIGTYTDECKEITEAITALRAALDAAKRQEHCPAPEMMGEHACKNKSQCWEPCGDLGHSEAHVRVAKKVEPVAWGIDWGTHGDQSCCSIIKKHPDGTMEVVAVEYSPTPQSVVPEGWKLLEDAIVSMVEDGWLSYGAEGMSEAQNKCYAAYQMLSAAPKKEGE